MVLKKEGGGGGNSSFCLSAGARGTQRHVSRAGGMLALILSLVAVQRILVSYFPDMCFVLTKSRFLPTVTFPLPRQLQSWLREGRSRGCCAVTHSTEDLQVIGVVERSHSLPADPTCTVWTMRATTSHAACSPPALGRHTQFGVLDNGYKFDMDDQEALELAHKAIHHAIFRDLASGGIVRVYQVYL
ncbi:putative proteasome subunit beta type-5 isoform X7 [Ixodes scapularis]